MSSIAKVWLGTRLETLSGKFHQQEVKLRVFRNQKSRVGDDHVTYVVCTYSRLMPRWDVLIYYLHNACGEGAEIPRLCSVDLLPHKRTPFAQVKLPSDFVKKHVTAVDAAWDEYSDGVGLKYEVYSTKPTMGTTFPAI